MHVFMDLVHWYTVMLEEEGGPSPNCSHKFRNIKLLKMSLYPEELRDPFTGAKEPSTTPEK